MTLRISLNIAYPLEILSFKIRANGLFMQGIATNVCLAISQFVIPIGIDAGSWKFYFFFEGWLLIQLVTVYFFFIETRGATLEEINKTFDGAEAVEEIKQIGTDTVGVSDLTDVGIGQRGGSIARKGGDDGVGVEVAHVDELHEKSL